MFSKYSDLVAELKATDRYFQGLTEKIAALDRRIGNIESRLEPGSPDEIEILRGQRRRLADEVAVLLERARLSRVAS